MPLRFSSDTSDLIGAHVSTRGGLHTAFDRGRTIDAGAIAFFSKNSNQWRARELTDDDCWSFRKGHAGSGSVPLLVHASYLINLASTDGAVHEKSIAALVVELERAERLGAHAVVLHPGAHLGSGVAAGIDKVARSIDRVHASLPDCNVLTLLETAAGQGSCLGCSFEELGAILERIDDPARVGICIDTCHIFGAGYEIRTRDGYERTMESMERHVGFSRVGAIHLNDSKRELGSRVDRHEHIGEGAIGLKGFERILNDRRLTGVPKVIETPKPHPFEADIRNLRRLRSLIRKSKPQGG